MSRIITVNNLNRLWQNGVLPIKSKVDDLEETGGTVTNKLTSYDDIMANTVEGYIPDALAMKEGFMQIGEDEDGMTVHEKLDYLMNNGGVINSNNLTNLYTEYAERYTDQSVSLNKTINIPQDGIAIINYGGSRTLNNIPTVTLTVNNEHIAPKVVAKTSPYYQAIFSVNEGDVLNLTISHSHSASSSGYTQYGITIELVN